MGREDSLRLSSRWMGGAMPGRIRLSGAHPLEGANRRFLASANHPYLGQTAAAPAVPITAADANRLQALLGRVVEEMKSQGKNPAGVLQVKAKLDTLASGATPESIMSLTPLDIQAMDDSLKQMKNAIDWTAIAVFGSALALLGSAAYFLAK